MRQSKAQKYYNKITLKLKIKMNDQASIVYLECRTLNTLIS